MSEARGGIGRRPHGAEGGVGAALLAWGNDRIRGGATLGAWGGDRIRGGEQRREDHAAQGGDRKREPEGGAEGEGGTVRSTTDSGAGVADPG